MVTAILAVVLSNGSSGWHSLYATEGFGIGPSAITFSISQRVGGKGYVASLFNHEDGPAKLAESKRFNEPIRFLRLESHQNPRNDYYKKNGTWIKQFPGPLFVGHGVEKGRPVSVVWTPGNEHCFGTRRLLKVFNGDASRLDQPEYRSKRKGGWVTEHCLASWLPRKEHSKLPKNATTISRRWTYNFPEDSFTAGPWISDRGDSH